MIRQIVSKTSPEKYVKRMLSTQNDLMTLIRSNQSSFKSNYSNTEYCIHPIHRKNIRSYLSTVCIGEIDPLPRNMLLIKNPQFSPNFYGTLSKWPAHELIILAKCHQNWAKIVDFLFIAYFCAGGQFRLYILYIS